MTRCTAPQVLLRNRSRTPPVVGAVGALLAVACIIGCHGSEVGRTVVADGPPAGHLSADARALILRRGNGAEPESLDPHAARSEAALTILRDLYEGLTAVDDHGEPVLAAADAVQVSADGRTYRFHLRPGGRWSNGEPVVAEDFAAAWRRLVDPHTGAQYAALLSPLRGAREIATGGADPSSLGVHAEDARVLVAELDRPTPYFLGILAHPATFPLNRRSLAAQGRRFAKPGVMVSNGAFVLTRWDFGSHLVAVRNVHYWNDAATRLDAIEYYSFADGAAELAAFRAGQLDITATVPAAQMAWIHGHFAAALHVAPQLAVYYLGLNLRRPPFQGSPQLREALSLVIDRERLVQSVTGGGEAPAYAFVPPQINDYTPQLPAYAHWPMPQRIARARQLLRDAGMEHRAPAVEIRYNNSELHNRIAIAVAGMWKQALDIDVTLRAEEFKVLLQDIDRGDAQVFRASWLGDYNDAYGFLQVMQSGFGLNLTRYASAGYDHLLDAAANEADAPRRRALLQDAEAQMLADQPLIPLYFYVSKHLVDAGVQGWRDNPLNIVYSKSLTKAGGAGRN